MTIMPADHAKPNACRCPARFDKVGPALLVLTMLLAGPSAWAQIAPVPVVAPGAAVPGGVLAPAQAQQAIELLQDDARRGQLIEALKAIAAVAPPPSAAVSALPAAPSAPAPPPAVPSFAADSLGAQLLGQASEWISDFSQQIATAARGITHFPALWHWLVEMANDPFARNLLLDTGWKLVLVIACALAAEWLVARALRRPIALLERCVSSRNGRRLAEAGIAEALPAGEALPAAEDDGSPPRQNSVAAASQVLLRLPFVLARLVLELLPIAAFAAVGNLLLATQLGAEPTPRIVILAMVSAYVISRVVMCVTRSLVSPVGGSPSLLAVRSEWAAYIEIWVRRLVIVAVFGVGLANVALVLGLYRSAYHALVKMVMLLVHLFIVMIILQCRQNVAAVIRAPAGRRGALAIARNRLADLWHYAAIILDLALWGIWALRVHNGYGLLLQYFLATVAVLVAARLFAIAALATLDRIFRISPDFLQRFPGLEARVNRYFPVLRGTVSGIIAVVAFVALLEVWGVNAVVWFQSGEIGGRLVSAALTVGIAACLALAVWETSNAAMERHLARLSREGQFVRMARLRTFLPMLRTALMCAILTVVTFTALNEIGVNIAPLLAGAGIVGIAIGFGSQKLVQDLITGLFLLLENAMQVGDLVSVSGLSGTVEDLSIRTVRLRAADGSVHIIPFSSVTTVTNTNRGIGNAAILVNVGYNEDTDRVGAILKEIAAQIRSDPDFKHLTRGDLELWGVDKVDASVVTIVGQIRCTDSGRWPVQREFNRRMKRRFQELGIEVAVPRQTVLVQQVAARYRDEAVAEP